VVVGVLDTGIDFNHEDLGANIWVGEKGEHGMSSVPGKATPLDDHPKGHGTHCAGIIGAEGDNGKGVVGVTWQVKLMALKCLDAKGEGDTHQVVQCIDFALRYHAKILNNSWVTTKYSRTLDEAIERAKRVGALFVAAAGNSANDNDRRAYYPGCYQHSNVIAVLAADGKDNRIQASNYGPRSVHLGAPGDVIYSCVPGNRYGYMTGTSQAAAFVSGAAALIWSHPTYVKKDYKKVKDDLLANVQTRRTLQRECQTGGVLDIRFLK
jgi:subtilisin family serine protease